MNPTREFVIEHAYKAEKFIDRFKEFTKKKNFESCIGPWQRSCKVWRLS